MFIILDSCIIGGRIAPWVSKANILKRWRGPSSWKQLQTTPSRFRTLFWGFFEQNDDINVLK
jgi:hypothetical protein